MARAPEFVTRRLAPQPEETLRVPTNDGLARGLAEVGRQAALTSQAFKEREERGAQLFAAKAMSDARAQWTRNLIERKENAEGEAAGFAEALETDFAEYSRELIANAPAAARGRLRLSLQNYGTQLAENSLVFEATKRVAHREDILGETIRQNANTVVSDPSQFDAVMSETLAAIEASGLPDDKRQAAERVARSTIAEQAALSLIENDPQTARAVLSSGAWDKHLDPQDKGRLLSSANAAARREVAIGLGGMIATEAVAEVPGDALALIRDFESFREDAYPDFTIRNGERVNSGFRTGFGSDTVTRADGTVEKVTKDTVVTREDAERDLKRRAKEFEDTARAQAGDGWSTLPAGARAALVSIAYNYGSLPDRIVDEARAGNVVGLAKAVEGLAGDNGGINRKRRMREAAIIRASAPDEVVASRVADIEDPETRRMVAREAAEQIALRTVGLERENAAREVRREQAKADLSVGVSRNEDGYSDIDAARDAGVLSPSEWANMTKAKDSAIEKARKEGKDLRLATERVRSGDNFNPFTKEDRDQVDALYKNSSKTPEAAIAITASTGVAPEAFIADLRMRMREGDAEAFNVADQMISARPRAFDREGGGDVQKRAQEFRAFTRIGFSEEQAIRRANRSAEEIDALKVQRETINKELKDLDGETVAGAMSTWLPLDAPDVPEAVSPYVTSDYQRLYQEARLDGLTAGEAKAVANERIKDTWGVSRISGSAQLMRHPPERYYPGGADFIVDQAKADLEGIGVTADNIRLVSDHITDGDIRAGNLPRYRLFYTDESGFMQVAPGYFVGDPKAGAAKKSAERREEFEGLRESKRARNEAIRTQPQP